MPSNVLKLLYFSLVYPHFTYGILIWGNAANYLLHKLFFVQKKFIRILSNAKYLSHTSNLFKNLQILKLNDVYVFHVNVFTFKIKNNMLPSCMDLVPFNTKQCYNLRYAGDVLQQYCRTNVRKYFITFSAVNAWNALPLDIKLITSISMFKKNLRSHMLSLVLAP